MFKNEKNIFFVACLLIGCCALHAQTDSVFVPRTYVGGEVGLYRQQDKDAMLNYGVMFEHQFAKHWGYDVGFFGLRTYYGFYRSEEGYSMRHVVIPANMIFYSKILNVRVGAAFYTWLDSKKVVPSYMIKLCDWGVAVRISHDFRVSPRIVAEPFVASTMRLAVSDLSIGVGCRLKYDFKNIH